MVSRPAIATTTRVWAGRNTIRLYGRIATDSTEAEQLGGIAPADFIEVLGGMRGTVNVCIDSAGGSAHGALAMARAMLDHEGELITHIQGEASSGASLVAVAGDVTIIAPRAKMMVHSTTTHRRGNWHDFHVAAQELLALDREFARFYSAKAGSTPADWLAKMRAETWFSAEEAVAAGLADRVVDLVAAPRLNLSGAVGLGTLRAVLPARSATARDIVDAASSS